ncbi:uncharacterized protein MAM_06688 [Metarhizium album ARSEF 1941]|uniref:Uncharacterized protein n=1 Tax=Metarhizium album (strain ARSEF 1941) TaxID=1081103 RepID=A0A0B2WHC7_METAS|nr:uncharacterized protein MAM_06688 [Metarhizium album ARSEF 1941]KHN95411.1 hypothetical protein MAM_06688 [Metarhizium album ARSEF 1941]
MEAPPATPPLLAVLDGCGQGSPSDSDLSSSFAGSSPTDNSSDTKPFCRGKNARDATADISSKSDASSESDAPTVETSSGPQTSDKNGSSDYVTDTDAGTKEDHEARQAKTAKVVTPAETIRPGTLSEQTIDPSLGRQKDHELAWEDRAMKLHSYDDILSDDGTSSEWVCKEDERKRQK